MWCRAISWHVDVISNYANLGSQTVGLTGHRYNAGLSTACNHSNVRTTILKVQYINIWISSLKMCFIIILWFIMWSNDPKSYPHFLPSRLLLISISPYLVVWGGLHQLVLSHYKIWVNTTEEIHECISLTSYLCSCAVDINIFSENISLIGRV